MTPLMIGEYNRRQLGADRADALTVRQRVLLTYVLNNIYGAQLAEVQKGLFDAATWNVIRAQVAAVYPGLIINLPKAIILPATPPSGQPTCQPSTQPTSRPIFTPRRPTSLDAVGVGVGVGVGLAVAAVAVGLGIFYGPKIKAAIGAARAAKKDNGRPRGFDHAA